jgi:uncharacterized protein with PIN domain
MEAWLHSRKNGRPPVAKSKAAIFSERQVSVWMLETRRKARHVTVQMIVCQACNASLSARESVASMAANHLRVTNVHLVSQTPP